MPLAEPPRWATASARSRICSVGRMRSPVASTPTLHAISIPISSLPFGLFWGCLCWALLPASPLPQFRQDQCKLLQAGQIVTGQQLVHERLGDQHADGTRLELLFITLQRVHPDELVAQAGEPVHGLRQHGGVSPVEAVRAD